MAGKAAALDVVFDSIERQFRTEKFKESSCERGWHIRLEIEQVEVGLIINYSTAR